MNRISDVRRSSNVASGDVIYITLVIEHSETTTWTVRDLNIIYNLWKTGKLHYDQIERNKNLYSE